ncbi:MAG: aconitase X catalytic domain-containing protein [Candidatus Altiarchaeota archaeon]|nr:aconitase X catalytic domain-containing protein [Candidatus Altiarchaeota archaeon]
MNLTTEEQAMLEGKEGAGVQKAMEILVALGEIYGARDMVPIASSQVSGVSYKNLGDAGLEFLQDWAEKGARVRVPTTMNPAGVDVELWKKLGISREFAEKQKELIRAYTDMGVAPSCTCTPYMAGNAPKYGEHIAWSESSAVCHANSILGARTNREGGPSALAAAIAGRTPRYGLHLDANRKASLVVEVECELGDYADYGALGYMIGRKAGNRIPYFIFKKNRKIKTDCFKTLGATMAAAGSVALYHVHGVTPEAKKQNMILSYAERFTVNDLEEGYDALDSGNDGIDFVAIGCPHASLDELREMAGLLRGRKVKTTLWITTARRIKKTAGDLVKEIEDSGAHVVADTCMIVAPVEELGFKSMATNAGKAAFYAPSHCGMSVRFGPLHRCIEAAVTGGWA